MTGFAVFIFLLQLFSTSISAVYIWSSPGALPTNIPASCRAALSQNLTCSGGLITGPYLASGKFPDNATLTEYCKPSCFSSLQTYMKNVDARCGNTAYQMYPNGSLQTGPSVADPLVWAFNTSCLQDQGKFCLPAIRNGSATACSKCLLKYSAAMLNNTYGRQRIQPGPFSSLLSSCKIPASSYPFTSTSATPSSSSPPRASCTGTTYKVQSGDTCQSISISKSIAIDRLIAGNSLPYNCTTLAAGTSLCLGPSCALQTVQAGQTCSDISNSKGFSTIQLSSWNPTIHDNCDNLDSMVGRAICVSPPGTTSYTESSMNISSSPTITPMFSGPWTTGAVDSNPPTTNTSLFAQTKFPTIPAGTYTVNATQESLVNAIMTLCPISDADTDNGWTVADLPDACESLLQPYCSPNLNSPSPKSTRFPAVCTPSYYSSTTATATGTARPSPIEPGTISSCTQYWQVLDGDTCYSIATHFGISTDQFYNWNPKVGSQCTGLWVGYYVCVKA